MYNTTNMIILKIMKDLVMISGLRNQVIYMGIHGTLLKEDVANTGLEKIFLTHLIALRSMAKKQLLKPLGNFAGDTIMFII